MKTETMAELYALRELVDPSNPLSRELINEQLKSGEEPGPSFYAHLQVAWRDGRLSAEEQAFCRDLSISYPVFIRMRFAVTPRPGESRFDAVKRKVFDLDDKRIARRNHGDETRGGETND